MPELLSPNPAGDFFGLSLSRVRVRYFVESVFLSWFSPSFCWSISSSNFLRKGVWEVKLWIVRAFTLITKSLIGYGILDWK